MHLYRRTIELVRPHVTDITENGEFMRVLVTGSRRFPWDLSAAVEAPLRACARLCFDQLVVTDGAASGLDTIAGQLAERLKSRDWTRNAVPANWFEGWREMAWRTGITPGHQRNQRMVDMGHHVCIGWPHPDPAVRSAGTLDCMTRAHKAGIPTFVVMFWRTWTIQRWEPDTEPVKYQAS